MLYFDIQNYADFKEKFGMRKTNDGSKVRTEKVALAIIKDMFRNKKNDAKRWDAFFGVKDVEQPMRMSDFAGKYSVKDFGRTYTNYIGDLDVYLSSDEYEIINGGLCYDGDARAVRYKCERGVFKMKASKFFAKIFTENGLEAFYGERMKVYLSEKFAERWTAYAADKCGSDYTLHVGNNRADFEKIYDGTDGDFGSCMSHEDQWSFYCDSVKAHAAWLENKDGDVMARCVIFDECKQKDTGKVFRIAERQYAKDQDDKLKSILIGKLYAGGYIDLHKRIGAGCNRGYWQDIQDSSYTNIDNPCFSIWCGLEPGDTLSYQDSFKEYNLEEHRAYNYGSEAYQLDDTSSRFEAEGCYDDYLEEYVSERCDTYAYWYDGRDREHSGNICESTRDDSFTYVHRGERCGDYVDNDHVVLVDDEYWYIGDEDLREYNDGYYHYSEGDYAEDTGDWMPYDRMIEWDGCYYANWTYSELLDKDVPDDLFDEVEAEYAEQNGYVKNDCDEWVKEGELNEVED